MLSGTKPVNMLCETSNTSNFPRSLKDLGNAPVNVFEETSRTVSFPSFPISDGKQPERLLFKNIISFNVLAIFPMLHGMQPVRLLLATTTTEAGDEPRVSGMVDVNLLLFKNKASSSFRKSPSGNLPSKLLYRRSRYLSEGNDKTTVGNEPTNRLLLTSSSYRRANLEKLLGIMPQKRLELIWNNEISVNRPNSTGRKPAMSSWLRSIPATTVCLGTSRASAQKTPL